MNREPDSGTSEYHNMRGLGQLASRWVQNGAQNVPENPRLTLDVRSQGCGQVILARRAVWVAALVYEPRL